jgi:hypothetical protein
MSAFTEAYRKLFPPPSVREVIERAAYKPCCDDFELAHKGDDQVGDPPIYNHENAWHLNCDGFVIKYCPFCGIALPAAPIATGEGK